MLKRIMPDYVLMVSLMELKKIISKHLTVNNIIRALLKTVVFKNFTLRTQRKGKVRR